LLQKRIDDLGFELKYDIKCGEFEEVITQLLDKVERIIPAFCFIDPIGYSGLPLKVIRRFLERPTTEAFINFMYEPISRFISVTSQHPHLDELFGSEEWRYVLDFELRQEKREVFLRDLYRRQLKTCARYVWPFKLTDPERARTMYYLFHCTNHPKGIRVMKEIMYRKGTVGTYSYQGKDDSQMTLFSTEPDTRELEAFLLEEFAGKEIEFDQMIDATLEAPFIETHYRKVLNDLRKRKIIEKVPVSTKGERGFRGQDLAIFSSRTRNK
jgi:hypothetical protein